MANKNLLEERPVPTRTIDLSRRNMLLMPLAVIGVAATGGQARSQQAGAPPRALVAYLSRTGNTRLIARQIARATNADIFEIETAAAYPEDYSEMVAQAERERQSGYEPALKASVEMLGSYETVFLGFPIWGTTTPSPVRSFLSSHAMSRKTLVPFITHGGFGLGSSLAVIAEHADGANILDAFSKQCDQERETLNQVTDWLGDIRIP